MADEPLCQVKVIDEQGNGVPGAMIACDGYDGSQASHEAVMTNDQGLAELHYPVSRPAARLTDDRVRRRMSVDIPGHAIGPVPFDLTPGKTTTITAVRGSSLSGVMTNSEGKPMPVAMRVAYLGDNGFLGWFHVVPDMDGRFTIDQLMPGVPFRLHLYEDRHQQSPRPEVWSEIITLKPGEHQTGLKLEIPQAAAIRGIVVDQHGEPVQNIYELYFWSEHGGWAQGEPEADGRFGSYAIAPGALKITIKAKDYKPFVSQPINLQAGEMAFIKLVMEKK